jgi:hypothetical protein
MDNGLFNPIVAKMNLAFLDIVSGVQMYPRAIVEEFVEYIEYAVKNEEPYVKAFKDAVLKLIADIEEDYKEL